MARPKTHRDVEFVVETPIKGLDEHVFKTFNEAAGHAVATGERSYLDVLIYSRAGARWWGGDDAVERYDEDPDASAFERFEIRSNLVGRVA